jgi:hypothetical protein
MTLAFIPGLDYSRFSVHVFDHDTTILKFNSVTTLPFRIKGFVNYSVKNR